MNTEDLLEVIGQTEETLLELSEKRKTKPARLLGMIAAVLCVCLLLPQVLYLLRPTHRIPPRAIAGDFQMQFTPQKDEGASNNGAVLEWDWLAQEYMHHLTVEVKAVEVLPDIYTYWDSGSQYHVIRMKVLDEIVGQFFPREIYFLLPIAFDPALTEYDSLFLNAVQCGAENYWMYNVDKNRLELFDFVFVCDQPYLAAGGGILAYKDGKLDTGLWDKEGWDILKHDILWFVEDDESPFPVRIGQTIPEAKAQIKAQHEQYFEEHHSVSHMFPVKVASQKSFWYYIGALWYSLVTHPLTGNMYVHTVDTYGNIIYNRVINGFPTNEYIYFEEDVFIVGRSVYNWVGFTQQDIKELPDLASAMNNPQAYLPEGYWQEDGKAELVRASGRYYKVDGKLYGVIYSEWRVKGYRIEQSVYILLHQDGTHQIVTYEELKEILKSV